jgi:hypothetical protein
MVTEVLAQILALGALTLVALLASKFLRLELTLSCFFVGLAAGHGLGYVDFDTGLRAHNLQEIVFFCHLTCADFRGGLASQTRVTENLAYPRIAAGYGGCAY